MYDKRFRRIRVYAIPRVNIQTLNFLNLSLNWLDFKV